MLEIDSKSLRVENKKEDRFAVEIRRKMKTTLQKFVCAIKGNSSFSRDSVKSEKKNDRRKYHGNDIHFSYRIDEK